ncbi:retrovirus-related pol polyprotein from transposon TNT 1-94 [Tanacetum coccineum]
MRSLASLIETSVARSPQQNGAVERHNCTLIEAARTMLILQKALLFLMGRAVATHVYTQIVPYFDELIAMASKHSSSGPALHEMTPATISSGLLFEELFTPPPSVDHPVPEVIAPIAEVVAPEPAASTGSSSSTTVDQDAPLPSNSQTTPKTHSPIIPNDVEEDNHDLDVAHMNNDLFFGIPIPEVTSDQSSSSDIIHTIAQLVALMVYLSRRGNDFEGSLLLRLQIRDNPNHVYKLKKALYGLKQAPRAWYDMLSSFLISQDFSKGLVDPTLFIRKEGKELLLVQVYVDDIIFAASTPELSSRPGLQFVICMCARYHARPTEKYLHAVKRIFRYLKRTVNQGLWYEKDSSIALTEFADADHVGCQDTRRSTSGSMQLLGDRLVSWSSKRQKSIAISSWKF